MPMISAAGYPTQETPTVSPSPTPGADYQSIPAATPNAFGAQIGTAQERLGGAFEQAGTGLAQASVQRQELTNQVAANQATNFAMDEVTKILHGDPNKPGDVGFYGLKGIDAVNARQATARSLDDIINKTRGTLSNARQQLSFDNDTRRMRNYWIGEIGRHYDQQLTQSAVNTAIAGQQLGHQGMASTAANQDQVGFSLQIENTMKRVQDQGKALGWTQEQYDAKFGEIRATATSLWTENLALKDPMAAYDFLEHNKDALAGKGDEYRRLHGEIDRAAQKQQTQRDTLGAGLVRGGAIQGAINTEGTGEGHVVAKTERLAYYKQKAAELGLNFDAVAATVAGEGLGKYTGDEGTSHGDFQLHTGGGMGDAALQAGIDIRNPQTWKQQADFALEQMAQHKGNAEWYAGQWHGAPAWAASTFSNAGGAAPTDNLSKYKEEYQQAYKARDEFLATHPAGRPGIPKYEKEDRGHETFEQWMAHAHADVSLSGAPDTTTPTQTGAQATPAAAGPADQLLASIPHDEGQLPDDQVPGLLGSVAEAFKKIGDDPGPYHSVEERKAAAVKDIRTRMNYAYADQQHTHKLEQEAQKAADEKGMSDYYVRLGKGEAIDTGKVLQDTKLSPEARKTIVGFIERENRQDPAALTSKNNTRELFRRMTLPPDDPDKTYSMKPAYDAYVNGDISRQDMAWLQGQSEKALALGNEQFTNFTNRQLKAMEKKVMGAQAVLSPGMRSEAVIQRYQDYVTFAHDKIQSYKDSNKDPHDLFNPQRPDNIVSDEFLRGHGFAPNLTQATAPPPETKLDVSTPTSIARLQRQGKLTYDQAAQALSALGYKFRDTAPSPVPVR